MSTQPSSNPIHHPSPIIPHASPAVTFSPHPSMAENQFTHAPPPPPVHIGIPGYVNHQGPALRMENAAYGAYPFLYYYPMPLIQPLPNPVCTLPTLMHIPLLSSHLDFAPWGSGIRSVLCSLGLIGHIVVTSDPIHQEKYLEPRA